MPERRNYQKELEKIIEQNDGKEIPRLLLHCCCAPCSSYVLEYLSEFFDITVFFYNPNIEPRDEYDFRLVELHRLTNQMPLARPVRFLEGAYENTRFHQEVQGLEEEKEGGARCEKCFRLRLERSAQLAKRENFDYFTTTLSISPLKSAEKLNNIGEKLAKIYGVPYLCSDFKKRDGYRRSIELSRDYQLYRQNYCGCVYSKREAQARQNPVSEQDF